MYFNLRVSFVFFTVNTDISVNASYIQTTINQEHVCCAYECVGVAQDAFLIDSKRDFGISDEESIHRTGKVVKVYVG